MSICITALKIVKKNHFKGIIFYALKVFILEKTF